MAAVTREELRQMIDELPETELEAAEQALRHLSRERDEQRHASYERRLLASGLTRRIPSKPTKEDIRRFREWKPIRIEGKPVSVTLVEERR